MLNVEVSLVDGSAMPPWTVEESAYQSYLQLHNDGFKGRDIVDQIITDDWGAPPTNVHIFGVLTDGTRVDVNIHCDTRRRRRR